MTDRDIKNLISNAVEMPKAPKDLVAMTIERGKAIELGRDAEKKLYDMKSEAPTKETKVLAARGVVGRMMQTMAMPKGATADLMAKEILRNDKFQKASEITTDKLLMGVVTGTLVKTMIKPADITKKQTGVEPPQKTEVEPTKMNNNGGLGF